MVVAIGAQVASGFLKQEVAMKPGLTLLYNLIFFIKKKNIKKRYHQQCLGVVVIIAYGLLQKFKNFYRM